jgi:hypothetical protein
MSHLLDRKHEVCQQHGGVVTSVSYDKLEEMTLKEFIDNVVPTLDKNDDKFMIIKDTVRQNMYRILKDNVAVYHITGIQDVFFDLFLDNLMSERPVSITPNLTYPLISYATTKNGEKVITVAVTPKQFTYHSSSSAVKPFVVWHPPLWLQCVLTPANIPSNVKIGVVLDRSDDPADVTVYHLPLPNCYSDGNICFGGTRFNNPNPNKALTEATAIEMTYQRLFNSEFNMDLVTGSEASEFYKLCQKLPDWDQIKDDLEKGSDYSRYAKKIQYGWRDQSSIWKYNYRRICDGRRFLTNAGH